MSGDEGEPKVSPEDASSPAPPPTKLAEFARRARERLGPEPDRATPAATRTMAAIVRDLKGLPELVVKRESAFKLKLGRRGKVPAITIEYHEKIGAIELAYLAFPDTDPTTTKVRRYTFAEGDAASPKAGETGTGEWTRLDGGGELVDDVRDALAVIYPELGDP